MTEKYSTTIHFADHTAEYARDWVAAMRLGKHFTHEGAVTDDLTEAICKHYGPERLAFVLGCGPRKSNPRPTAASRHWKGSPPGPIPSATPRPGSR